MKRLRYRLWRFWRFLERGREVMDAPGAWEDQPEQRRWYGARKP